MSRITRLLPILFGGKSAAQLYQEKVLSLSPIAYWPLTEASGTAAVALVGTNGTYARDITLMTTAAGPIAGTTAPNFSTDYVDIYSAGLAAAFSGVTGSAVLWLKVSAAGVWSDGADRKALHIYGDASNFVHCSRTTSNGVLTLVFRGGGTTDAVSPGSQSDTGWVCWAMTWDTGDADALIVYKSGAQIGTTQTTLGTWGVATLSNTLTLIGAINKTPAQPWSGQIAHVQIYDKVLTPAQLVSLATP